MHLLSAKLGSPVVAPPPSSGDRIDIETLTEPSASDPAGLTYVYRLPDRHMNPVIVRVSTLPLSALARDFLREQIGTTSVNGHKAYIDGLGVASAHIFLWHQLGTTWNVTFQKSSITRAERDLNAYQVYPARG